MAHAAPEAPVGLAPRVVRWWLGTSAVAAALALALGSPAAGLVVLVVLVASVGLARWGWLRELGAVDALAVGLEDERVGRGPLPEGLPGDAGNVGREVAALIERAREAEAAGRAWVERTTHILEAAPSGVVIVGSDGRIEHVNETLRGLLGLHRDPRGLLPLEALHAIEVAQAIDEALDGRVAAPRDMVKDERDLLVSAHPMASGVLAVVRDVSSERRVERSRTDFVANVSHELRTPITTILGFSETLLETPGGLPADVAPMVRAIQRSANRLRQLFEDLLTLHRIEARRHELPRRDVLLAPLLAEAAVPSSDAAASKGLTFEVDVPDDLRAFVNPQALSAIVGNLAGNACKYTFSGGRVTVRAVAIGGSVRIDVSDTGLGIPSSHHTRVFERFYRVDEGRAREVGGTGLGLAIAKHLAEATGCRITLQSEEGRGSTFSVHVPRAAPSRIPRTWDATLEP